MQVRDVEFLRKHTTNPIKITVPGPFTMSQKAQDHHYGDPKALALACAAAVNEEVKEFSAGADYVQLDEPYMQARPDEAGNMVGRRLSALWMALRATLRSISASVTPPSSMSARTGIAFYPSWATLPSKRFRSRRHSRTLTLPCSRACLGRP